MTLIHLTLVILTGLIVIYSDEQAFMWVLGKKHTLNARTIDILHIVVSIGLAGIIATGGLMAIRSLSYFLSDPLFLTKMFFVGALIINGFFIDKLSTTATERPFRELSNRERLPLLVSGAVSVTGWVGAGICGLILA